MTGTLDYRRHDLASSRIAEWGYLEFLDNVVVDAQPHKRTFREIAEWWQWDRAERCAAALDNLCGLTEVYSGTRSFWEEYHKGSDKTHEDARELLYVLGWSRNPLNCYVCAGTEDQAALITTAMRGVCRDNPWIADRVHVSALTATGGSGSTLTVLPKNAYSGQGIFPDFVVASEVTHWQHEEGRRMWEFVLESVNKRPHCILKVETNAGMKGSWQWEERNRVASSKFWSFYTAPVGKPLPSWMNQEKIDDDSQGLTPGERDRLYKNRWVDPGEEHGYLTEAEALLCRDHTLQEVSRGLPSLEYYAVVDYGGVNDRCALSVLHAVPGTDRAIVDRLDCWQGTHEDRIAIDHDEFRPHERSVESWLLTVLKNFRIAGLVLDPHQLEGLAIKYERRGVPVFRFEYRGGKANYRLAQILKTSVQNRKVSWSPRAGLLPVSYTESGRTRLVDDRTLEQEMAGLVTRPMSYGYRFDHESGKHDDRCLVGSTLVSTDKGDVPIRDVIAGDRVLTRLGYRDVLWSGPTRIDETFKVEFDDGTVICGTANHPILTNHGWTPVEELEVGDVAWRLSKSWSTADGNTAVTRSRSGATIGSTSNVTTSGRGRPATYTETCGLMPTDQYPRGMTFTTKTVTHSTISCQIWNASPDKTTTPNILNQTDESGKNGYKLKTARQTPSKLPNDLGSGSGMLLLKNVRESLRRRGRIDELRQFDALYATFLSRRISRIGHSSVPPDVANAPSASAVRVVSVTRSNVEVVYDLTVDERHEFFANGILVHNSVAIAMGLLHVLPNALPAGSLGPTVVVRDPKEGYKPLGTVPTHGRKSEFEDAKPEESNGYSASVGRWNLFGVGNRNDW